jgi:predicted permease
MFVVVAILSLALGIGANTAIFSLLKQVALQSLPVTDPASLVVLHTSYSAPGTSSSDNREAVFSYPMYRDLRDRDSAFSGVVARMGTGVTLTYQGNSEQASAEVVTGNFFTTLGVGAAIGRVFTQEEDGAPGAHPVIVLSHTYWSTHMGKRLDILNQTIAMNGFPMVVVGVAEAGFHGLISGQTPDVFVPIAMQKAVRPTWDVLEDRRFRWLNLFARLKPGISPRQAQATTDVVYRTILEAELARIGKMRSDRDRDEFLAHRAELRPAAQGINIMGDRFGKPLQVLMAMVGLVLLIACANVANLMLARAAGRQREIAIRLAMGARRWSLVKQLLLEGLVLALAGGIAGLLVAGWSMDTLIRLLPSEGAAKWLTSNLSWPLLGFSMALSIASGLLFGLVPALQATRPDVADTLKNQATNVLSGGGAARFRKMLVVAQVALSLLLVVGASLFAGSLINLTRVNLGFRTEHLLLFSVNATLSRTKTPDAVAFYRDLENRLAAVPGIAGVSAAADGPFGGGTSGGNLTIEGYHPRPDEYVGASRIAAGPGFFRAMGIPLRAGREFGERDAAGASKVVVVNEAFARRYFAGASPIGRRMMMGDSNHPVLDLEIVGLAADSHVDVREAPKETFYFPYMQWDRAERLSYYVRAAGDERRLATDIRNVVHSADANVPMGTMRSLDVRIRESIYTDRLIAMLSGAFGVLATLLAAIGLYGVVAYTVARRTAEIGIRIALGALPADVLRMVLLEAGRMAAMGIAIGLCAAFGLSRLVASQLFEIKAANPLVYAGAGALLAVVAMLAALAPGWRASHIDTLRALKYE